MWAPHRHLKQKQYKWCLQLAGLWSTRMWRWHQHRLLKATGFHCFLLKIDWEIPQERHCQLDTDCRRVRKAKHPEQAATDRSQLSVQLTPRWIYNGLYEEVSFCRCGAIFCYFPPSVVQEFCSLCELGLFTQHTAHLSFKSRHLKWG